MMEDIQQASPLVEREMLDLFALLAISVNTSTQEERLQLARQFLDARPERWNTIQRLATFLLALSSESDLVVDEVLDNEGYLIAIREGTQMIREFFAQHPQEATLSPRTEDISDNE